MQITAIRLDRLRLELDPPFRAAWDPVPRRFLDATLVRVETDEGITGIGSGDTMAGFEPYAELFVGHDPLALNRHVRALETVNFHAGRFWPLEAALWDIAGQVAGLPVATLLGNATERLPAYMSTGELKSPQQRVEVTLAGREQGFRATKIRIARDALSEGVAAVRGVREALGDDFTVLVDLNQSWRMPGDVVPALDVKAVARTVAELAELGVGWVEEPLPYGDVAGLAELRRTSTTRIAGGEMLPTFEDALRLLEARRARRLPDGLRALARHLPLPDLRRAGPAPAPRLHPAHLEQRHRAAHQPAAGRRGRRRAVVRGPVRPRRLDS